MVYQRGAIGFLALCLLLPLMLAGCGKVKVSDGPPLPPASVHGYSDPNSMTINLSWSTSKSANATGYVLYKALSGQERPVDYANMHDKTSFVDVGATIGQTYQYWIGVTDYNGKPVTISNPVTVTATTYKIGYISQGNIYTMTPNGKNVTLVKSIPDVNTVSWSPDASKIAYIVWLDGLWVMNADGSNAKRLADASADTYPAWSPDGTRIAFATNAGYGDRLTVVNADGSGLSVLTNYGGRYRDPDWSPDGSQIAYVCNSQTLERDLCIIDLHDMKVTHLGATPEDEWHPAWSPDGTKLLYAARTQSPNTTLSVITLSSKTRTPIKTLNGGGSHPDWSPNGKKILYELDGWANTHLMDLDGSNDTTLPGGIHSTWLTPEFTKL